MEERKMNDEEEKKVEYDDDEFRKMLDNKRRYYTPAEVSLHNCAKDCWVSVQGKVLNLTSLLEGIEKEDEQYELTLPIVAHAGKDVSEWFDDALEVKKGLDEVTGLVLPILEHGRFMHVAPSEPVSNWSTDFDEPWWRDEKYVIGSLSKSTRFVIFVNMLTYQETKIECCEEETLEEIRERYMDWNGHAGSYTMKVLDDGAFRPLDLSKTLTENGIEDETQLFNKLSISPETYVPTIHCYFNDDLTEG